MTPQEIDKRLEKLDRNACRPIRYEVFTDNTEASAAGLCLGASYVKPDGSINIVIADIPATIYWEFITAGNRPNVANASLVIKENGVVKVTAIIDSNGSFYTPSGNTIDVTLTGDCSQNPTNLLSIGGNYSFSDGSYPISNTNFIAGFGQIYNITGTVTCNMPI